MVYNRCLGLCFMGAKHIYWSFSPPKKKAHVFTMQVSPYQVWSRYRDKVIGTEDLPMESSMKTWLVNICQV